VQQGATGSAAVPGSNRIGRTTLTNLAWVFRFVLDAACKYLLITLRFE
jgi:hypothetical protein